MEDNKLDSALPELRNSGSKPPSITSEPIIQSRFKRRDPPTPFTASPSIASPAPTHPDVTPATIPTPTIPTLSHTLNSTPHPSPPKHSRFKRINKPGTEESAIAPPIPSSSTPLSTTLSSSSTLTPSSTTSSSTASSSTLSSTALSSPPIHLSSPPIHLSSPPIHLSSPLTTLSSLPTILSATSSSTPTIPLKQAPPSISGARQSRFRPAKPIQPTEPIPQPTPHTTLSPSLSLPSPPLSSPYSPSLSSPSPLSTSDSIQYFNSSLLPTSSPPPDIEPLCDFDEPEPDDNGPSILTTKLHNWKALPTHPAKSTLPSAHIARPTLQSTIKSTPQSTQIGQSTQSAKSTLPAGQSTSRNEQLLHLLHSAIKFSPSTLPPSIHPSTSPPPTSPPDGEKIEEESQESKPNKNPSKNQPSGIDVMPKIATHVKPVKRAKNGHFVEYFSQMPSQSIPLKPSSTDDDDWELLQASGILPGNIVSLDDFAYIPARQSKNKRPKLN